MVAAAGDAGIALARPEHGLAATAAARAGTAAVVLALFMERFERVEGAGEYPLAPFPDLFFVIAVGLFGVVVGVELIRGNGTLRPLGPKDAAVVGFAVALVAVSFLAVVTQPESITRALQVTKTSAHLAFLVLAALLLGRTLTPRLVGFALDVFLAAATGAAVVGVLQTFELNVLEWGLSDDLRLFSRRTEGFARPCSIFSEPAYLGYFSLAGMVVAFAFTGARRPKRVTVPAFSICLVALLFAAAAGPLAVAGPVLGYIVIRRRALIDTRIIAMLFAVVAVAIVAIGLTPVGRIARERISFLSRGEDPSANLRRELIEGSIEIWQLAPATGVGLGNTRLHMTRYARTSYFVYEEFHFNSANAYVNLLGETGPAGVAALVAVIGFLWWRNRGAPSELEDPTRAVILLYALAFLIIGGLLMPPFWVWAGFRLALQEPG